ACLGCRPSRSASVSVRSRFSDFDHQNNLCDCSSFSRPLFSSLRRILADRHARPVFEGVLRES
ncbi:unnamed protein product, partial [Musa acuminata subsp. burmannicoides]